MRFSIGFLVSTYASKRYLCGYEPDSRTKKLF
jgi:hypothetical protein